MRRRGPCLVSPKTHSINAALEKQRGYLEYPKVSERLILLRIYARPPTPRHPSLTRFPPYVAIEEMARSRRFAFSRYAWGTYPKLDGEGWLDDVQGSHGATEVRYETSHSVICGLSLCTSAYVQSPPEPPVHQPRSGLDHWRTVRKPALEVYSL